MSVKIYINFILFKRGSLPCCLPCLRLICVSGWFPADPDTNPTPPESQLKAGYSSHLKDRKKFSLGCFVNNFTLIWAKN